LGEISEAQLSEMLAIDFSIRSVERTWASEQH